MLVWADSYRQPNWSPVWLVLTVIWDDQRFSWLRYLPRAEHPRRLYPSSSRETQFQLGEAGKRTQARGFWE